MRKFTLDSAWPLQFGVFEPPGRGNIKHDNELLTRALCSDHIAELNNTKPKQPFFFLKPTSSIVMPGEGPCLRPKGVDMHYEVELAIVVGKKLRDLPAEDKKGALDAVRGEFVSFLAVRSYLAG